MASRQPLDGLLMSSWMPPGCGLIAAVRGASWQLWTLLTEHIDQLELVQELLLTELRKQVTAPDSS